MRHKETLNVMIVSAYFPPANSPGVHRVIRFARQLMEDAWRVSIITMDPNYFDSHAKNDETLLERVTDGVIVHRTKVFRGLRKMAEIKGGLRRITKKPMIERRPISDSTAGTPLRRGMWQGLREWLIDIVQFPDPDIGWYWYALRRGGGAEENPH